MFLHRSWIIFAMHFYLKDVFIVGIHVKIRLQADNGSYEDIDEEYDDSSVEPPFQVPETEEPARPPTWKTRYKRMIRNDEPFVRTVPECTKWMDKIRSKAKNRPIQLAYVVDIKEDVKMTCHFCGNVTKIQGSIRWMRLGRRVVEKRTGAYLMSEIKGDMHDDENKNRVTISDDLTLMIKNVSEKDAGSYFCQNRLTSGHHRTSSVTSGSMRRFFTAKDTFRFYYHLDIILPSKIPVRRVSEIDDDYPKPAVERKDANSNLIYYTAWGEWTTCSVCGEVGEMKRHGTCMGKLYKDKAMEPPFLYFILFSYQPGLPCRSTLFKDYSKLKPRPDEIEIKSCNISCGVKRTNKRMKTKLNKLTFGNAGDKLPQYHVNATVGTTFVMECPGATIDTLVYWVNGSSYMPAVNLRKLTKSRVEIDAYSKLRIYDVRFTDSGTYTCWYGGEERVKFIFVVLDHRGEVLWVRHFRYLCYSFLFDFFIFTALMLLQHQRYREQQKLKRYKDGDFEKEESTESLISSGTGTLYSEDVYSYSDEVHATTVYSYDSYVTETGDYENYTSEPSSTRIQRQ